MFEHANLPPSMASPARHKEITEPLNFRPPDEDKFYVKKTDPPSPGEPFVDDGRPADQLSDPELADAYFDRKSRVDAFAPTKDRCESLAREARRRFEDKPADQEFELKSPSTLVQVGMKQKERSISSIFRLYKLSKLKIEEFLLKCKISLAEAQEIPGSAALIDEARTGFRSLKAIKRMPTAPE